MKKLYFIKETTGKWNFCLVVNGRQILESIKKLNQRQNYSRFKNCLNIAYRNLNINKMETVKTTRQEFNKLFKKKK